MKISILGCGWLGLPLAEQLVKSGYNVKGSTTTRKKLNLLRKKGIEPYFIHLSPGLEDNDCEAFWETDVLLINIPPGRRRENVVEFHTKQIRDILQKLKTSPVSFVIFVSSTSVYPKLPGIVSEDDAVTGKAGRSSGNALLQAEALLTDENTFDTTIVRFGGLYGYDRNPANYLASKKNLDRGKAPVNLIHQDDCVRILKKIIENDIRGEVFNAVSDGHPPRNMYYKAVAESAGIKPPTFKEDQEKNYKVVSNKKLKKKLGYQFIHPNPMDVDV